jgi:hypothetical protein
MLKPTLLELLGNRLLHPADIALGSKIIGIFLYLPALETSW